MRIATTIFLLLIHLFNLVGYKVAFAWMEQKASHSIVSKLDRGQYHDEDLLELKVPYQSLYYTMSPTYERFDGEIEIRGNHFNYVKRKFVNDTLYLLCIPNETSTRLASAKNSFLNTDNEVVKSPVKKSKQTPSSKGLKSFSEDCNDLKGRLTIHAPVLIHPDRITDPATQITERSLPALYKPPKQLV